MTNQTTNSLSPGPLSVGRLRVEEAATPLASRWYRFLPAIAGIGYGVAWVVGLAIWPSNLSVDASDSGIVSLYAAHTAQAIVQYLLVEGLAGLFLAVVLLSFLRQISRANRDRPWTVAAAISGGLAVVLSVSQCLLGMFLVSSARQGHLGQSGDFYALINRLDGMKQLLLAATVVPLAIFRRSGPRFPLWTRRITVVLGIALIASGLAYLLLWNALAGSTFISLPLLVLWLAGTGLWSTRRMSKPRPLQSMSLVQVDGQST